MTIAKACVELRQEADFAAEMKAFGLQNLDEIQLMHYYAAKKRAKVLRKFIRTEV